jgi:hypothetical protein
VHRIRNEAIVCGRKLMETRRSFAGQMIKVVPPREGYVLHLKSKERKKQARPDETRRLCGLNRYLRIGE